MPYGDPRFYPADPLVSADFAGWWQRGFAVVRRGWRQLALVQLIAAVPALALLVPSQLAVDLATRDTAGAAAEGRLELGGFLAASGLSILTLFAAGLIYSIGTLASVRVVVTVATGGEARVGRALRSVLPRVPALIGWSLLAAVIGFVALLACILPVFYVSAVFVLLPAVVLFEPGGGISRCFDLFHTDFGAAVARIATIAGLGIGILLTPLIVATYTDLRARREPFITAYLSAG